MVPTCLGQRQNAQLLAGIAPGANLTSLEFMKSQGFIICTQAHPHTTAFSCLCKTSYISPLGPLQRLHRAPKNLSTGTSTWGRAVSKAEKLRGYGDLQELNLESPDLT